MPEWGAARLSACAVARRASQRNDVSFTRFGEFILQAKEILVRLQLRIVLDYKQQAAEGSIQLAVGGNLFLRSSGGQQRGAGFGDIAEHGLLLLRIAFDRLDQVGDQVDAPLQVDVDLRPSGFHRFVLADQTIADSHVLAKNCERNEPDDDEYDDRN